MSDDLKDRLRHGVATYDDMADAADLIDSQQERIEAQAAAIDDVRGYLSRLLQSLHPAIDLLPTMLGVCTQVDNVLAGQKEEITRLRAALATARRDALAEIKQDTDEAIELGRQDGMEYAAQIADGRPSDCGEDIAAAIRAAAGEGEP
jgi:type I site-specific restriction endonuclease